MKDEIRCTLNPDHSIRIRTQEGPSEIVEVIVFSPVGAVIGLSFLPDEAEKLAASLLKSARGNSARTPYITKHSRSLEERIALIEERIPALELEREEILHAALRESSP